MSKRNGSDGGSNDATMEIETLRNGAATRYGMDEPAERGGPAKRSDEERLSLFWRVFGGTIISVAALVAITIYNGLNTQITELRTEVSRLNEARGDTAKKDDLNALRAQVATHAEYRREIDSLKERATKHRAEIDEAKKESTAHLDTLKKDMATLEVLKERLATATADAKSAKDDLTKLRQDVDKNQAYDLERRDRRDTQMKQLDETLKELQKNVLEAREKIARLEGQQTTAKPAVSAPIEVGPPAPAKSSTSGKKPNSGPRPVTPAGEK